MNIKLYNSMNNEIELFKPIEDGKVSIYYCGPTVYGPVHIGNMRPAIVFDTLKRFLLSQNFDVTLVSNLTDIDDKIINTAIKENVSEKQISERYIELYRKNFNDVNCLPLDAQPKVSENISEIIDFISDLIKKGYAYVNGDVFFRVSQVPNYGKVANINLDELRSGSRIDTDERKENPFDFVLWKITDTGIKFPSPWGEGRPGWHTECVVMIKNVFHRPLIDIHGGGFDLKFPHHTNEIAQSYGCSGTCLANYWMHNGFLNINNEKMSKSLGNVKTAVSMIEEHGGNAIRYVILSTYYRSPINFTDELFENAKNELNKIEDTYLKSYARLAITNNLHETNDLEIQSFYECLANDLNISNGLSEVFKLCKNLNQLLRNKDIDFSLLNKYFFTLKQMLYILGLKFNLDTFTSEDFKNYESYQEARKNKDFAKSDELRERLTLKHLL